MEEIKKVGSALKAAAKTSDDPAAVLRAPELGKLAAGIKQVDDKHKPAYGKALNTLKQELAAIVAKRQAEAEAAAITPIDVTAPFDVSVGRPPRPQLLPTTQGSAHPLMSELERVIDIFTRMGFAAVESRQLDNDYNMFTALNFPEGHPARDGYDTFRTEEGLIPPAHTSTMQNRILRAGRAGLEQGTAIASISYGRVFRNEDVDATHEHTFYQVEGVYVARDASLAQMLAVLRSFFETYYGQTLKIKTQPAYFPFVEPGLEFAIEKPAALGGKPGEWLEMLGCGMIHPNVLKEAGIDPAKYRGFAWGGGLDRLVMLAHGIEDVRHFESAKLNFLRKFA
ncbi:phenylalanine--tRNA ligase subunit alpha [Candidatus Saccharibacteria bacterium]|nr:phenylalanine--tRNA ligase subunit alpha [Candidatus Saccharibacteria bacterium]